MPPKSRKSSAKKPSQRLKKTTPEASDPLPTAAAENADVPADGISAAAAESDEVSPMEEEIAPASAVEEETTSEMTDKIVEETTTEKIVEETTTEKVEEETLTEKVVEETTTTVRVEEETVAAASGDVKTTDSKENETGEESESEEEEEPEEEGDKQIVEVGTGEDEVESFSGDDEESREEDEENEEEEENEGDEDEEENEEDDSMYLHAPSTEAQKQKAFEIFIGGLDKGAVEEDLVEVFGVFGEIQSVRIVKHPVTQKSKGFAFIRYASMEHAKKAVTELKDGTEVKGKKVRVSVSQGHATLYLGNIHKAWTRDNVFEALKGYGIEEIDDIHLPKHPKNERKTKGFAFLEFKSHSDAMEAFQRLRKPDAVFGRDVSAKVSFAQSPLHPCEEDLIKVKTVYMEGIPKSWDEEKVEEVCRQYGAIEKIQLSRNFTSSKRKDFGFIEFSSRDSAVACVEGINNNQLGEDLNLKANIAKPLYKGLITKQSRGGYKLQKNGEASEEIVKSKNEKAKAKKVNGKKETLPKLKGSHENIPFKSQDKSLKEKKGYQRVKFAEGKKRGRKGTDTAINQRPSKKARKNHKYGKDRAGSSIDFNNPRSSYSSNLHISRQNAYAPPATSYAAHAYTVASVSQHRRTDLEPHAGYLSATEQARNPYGYDGRRIGAYGIQPQSTSRYVGGAATHIVQSAHPGYSSYAGYEAHDAHLRSSGGANPYPYPYPYPRPPYY